jgi:cyclic pyranopterin phosphate synthase
LVRRGIMTLVRSLSRHLGDGLDELTLTTNGSQLPKFANELAGCGVKRINVSLDTLDPARFRAITRWGELDKVLAGIDAAQAAALEMPAEGSEKPHDVLAHERFSARDAKLLDAVPDESGAQPVELFQR